MKLQVTEIFKSISGEVGPFPQGSFVIFIRFAGCNLKCEWCDTKGSQDTKWAKPCSVRDIVDKVLDKAGECKRVILTGGEPLIQNREALYNLVCDLREHNFEIAMETNGSLDVPSEVGTRLVGIVYDYKLSSSGFANQMPVMEAWRVRFRHDDWLKFVILTREDYDEAKQVLWYMEQNKITTANIAFSACHPRLDRRKLFSWMLEDDLKDVIFNVQIHKVCGLK